MWRNRFGGGFGPVVRQTTKWNELILNMRSAFQPALQCVCWCYTCASLAESALPLLWFYKAVFLELFKFRTKISGDVHTSQYPIDYTLITNLMHWLLFIHKILLSSTCFEHQVLIFRRIQMYTCSIWHCHSLWEFLVTCRYTAWVRTDCRGKVVGRAS